MYSVFLAEEVKNKYQSQHMDEYYPKNSQLKENLVSIKHQKEIKMTGNKNHLSKISLNVNVLQNLQSKDIDWQNELLKQDPVILTLQAKTSTSSI